MHTTQSGCPRAGEVGRLADPARPTDPDLATHVASCPDCRAVAEALAASTASPSFPTAWPVPLADGPGPSDSPTRPPSPPDLRPRRHRP